MIKNENQNARRSYRLKNDPEYAEKIRTYDRARYVGTRKEKSNLRLSNRSSEQKKEVFIKSKYGITLDQYKAMWDKQNGVCAICKEPETRKNKHTNVCLLHIDHNHLTGKVRGLLCHKCNSAIGYFRDNPELLKSGLKYLEIYKEK